MNRQTDPGATAVRAARRFLFGRRAAKAAVDAGASVADLRRQLAAMEGAAHLGASIAGCMDDEAADEIRRRIADARRR